MLGGSQDVEESPAARARLEHVSMKGERKEWVWRDKGQGTNEQIHWMDCKSIQVGREHGRNVHETIPSPASMLNELRTLASADRPALAVNC